MYESQKKYYLKNKEKILANGKDYSKQYYKNNIDKIKQYRVENKEKTRKNSYLNLYKITLEEYESLLIKQNYVCAICKQPERIVDKRTNLVRNLAIDHCHNSNKIRGLLCNSCNQGLGKFKDNKNLLQEATNYLNKEDYCSNS
jgi:uncharacterized membrane protein